MDTGHILDGTQHSGDRGQNAAGHGSAPHDPAAHDAATPGAADWWIAESVGLTVLALALGAYVLGVIRHRERGPWPRWRTAAWIAGLACVGVGWAGPLAEAARHGFTAHMITHLLVGMLGPLLLVLAAPVTLALRTLPSHGARTVSSVLRSPPVRLVTHPVVAAALDGGGLWLLYTTDLFELMHRSMGLHVLVHVHILLAGLAFTVAMIGPDPNPHRAGLRTRATVLVLFIAVHSILGKWLYAHPPVGVDPADARTGAQLMYYGGDVVDLAVLILLFAGWYPGSRFRSRLLPGNPARDLRDHRIEPSGQPLESADDTGRGVTPWPRRRTGKT